MNKRLIYGKDETTHIVGAEVVKDHLVLYRAEGNKTVTETRPFYHYVLLAEQDMMGDCGRLNGQNDYQYFVKFKTSNEMRQYTRKLDYDGKDYWRCYNPVESAMLREGFTFFNDMQPSDVSVLSFDIETTGVKRDKNSFVVLISNTMRHRDGSITKRLFDYMSFPNTKVFLDTWCEWVRSVDPDVMVGHNIFNFDLPYLAHVGKLAGTKIRLGRNSSPIKIAWNPRKFRKDGSQSYDYNNVEVFGRSVIDTFFLSIRYDVARNYPSYGLKPIIKYEGLEKEGRQHWDFETCREPWNKKEDWELFKQYCKDDADDSLALYDLMIPQYFYYTQSIPKHFQEILLSATGSQVNSFMLRAYLQESESIPKANEKTPYRGAYSLGLPGLYDNVFGLDFKAMYPTIILAFNVYNKKKDPKAVQLEMTEQFLNMRDEYKTLYKQTGEESYNGMQLGAKIFCNSIYGANGAPGLNFNDPEGASFITEKGREYLNIACKSVTNKTLQEWGMCE